MDRAKPLAVHPAPNGRPPKVDMDALLAEARAHLEANEFSEVTISRKGAIVEFAARVSKRYET